MTGRDPKYAAMIDGERRVAFLTATKGVPARIVARALEKVTCGIRWPLHKGEMADAFAGGFVYGEFCEGLALETFAKALAEVQRGAAS